MSKRRESRDTKPMTAATVQARVIGELEQAGAHIEQGTITTLRDDQAKRLEAQGIVEIVTIN